MRVKTIALLATLVVAIRRRDDIRRRLRAVRVVHYAQKEFPMTLNHASAPAFGEALEDCVRRGMHVRDVVDMFASAYPHPLSDSDQVIFLQHLEPIARVYTPHILPDIRARIEELVPVDISSLSEGR